MRRQRARLWILYPGGDCWALVTSSPMLPEQGLCVGQVGFFIRLCSMLPRTCLLHHHELHPMHRFSSEPWSLWCLRISVTRWVCAEKWDRSQVSQYSRLRVGLYSDDKTRRFEFLQTEERARSQGKGGIESGRAFASLSLAILEKREAASSALQRGIMPMAVTCTMWASAYLVFQGISAEEFLVLGLSSAKALGTTGKHSSPKCRENLKKRPIWLNCF